MIIKVRKVTHIVGKLGDQYDARYLTETVLIPENMKDRDDINHFVQGHVPEVEEIEED